MSQADEQPQVVAGLDPKATHVAVEWKYDHPLINCRFDPQARFVFATSEDRTIQRWEIASGTRVGMSGHDSWARGITFSADGETMITSEKPLTATQVRRGTYINTGSKDVGPDPDWNAKENTYKGTNYIQDADKAVWIRSSSTK